MEGDVIANRTDLSRMQVGEHLNSAKFNVILRCGNNTEIVSCGKRASIIVVEQGCEGRDFLSSRQPESCPKPFSEAPADALKSLRPRFILLLLPHVLWWLVANL